MPHPRFLFFLANAGIMMSALFIPNYTRALGGSLMDVGMVGAAYGFSLFFSSYLFGRASDMRGRMGFIAIGLLVSFGTFLLQTQTHSPFSLLLVRGMAGFSLGIFTAPLVACASEYGEKMGTLASYGSMGWAVGVMMAGITAQMGESFLRLPALTPYHIVFFVSALFFLTAFILVMGGREKNFQPVRSSLIPIAPLKKNFAVYLSYFLRNLGAFSLWTIFPLYLSHLGANKFWIGTLYFINTGTQTLVMRQLNFTDEVKLIKAGLFFSFLVFFSYSLAPVFWWVIPLQLCLAFSFSFLYVGNLFYLTRRNEDKAACIGILNSLTGICLGLGPFLAGLISQYFGFPGVIYFSSLLALLGFMVMLFMKPR